MSSDFWRHEFSKFMAFFRFVQANSLPLPIIYRQSTWQPIMVGNLITLPEAHNDH